MQLPKVVVLLFLTATAMYLGSFTLVVEGQTGPTNAPTGFNLESNGFAEEFCANQAALTDSPNSPMIPDAVCNFDEAVEEFMEVDDIADGLGPIFNAASCGECHLVPIVGGSS
jgi:hypothetical protein